jgi:hypothetical protein
MKSRRRVNSDVMFLPYQELCGSRLNYKLVHASIRVATLVGIALVFVVAFAGRFNPPLEQLTVYFFFGLPIAVLFIAVFESFWFRRTEHETRAVAVDWLFVLALLVVWAFEMVRILLTPVFL